LNYSTTEKELLAIVWSIQHFRPYLYGRDFEIITDHKPVVWLFNVKDPGSRLMRWRLKLEEYQYKIIHKPGKLNCNADALSRMYPIISSGSNVFDLIPESVIVQVITQDNVHTPLSVQIKQKYPEVEFLLNESLKQNPDELIHFLENEDFKFIFVIIKQSAHEDSDDGKTSEIVTQLNQFCIKNKFYRLRFSKPTILTDPQWQSLKTMFKGTFISRLFTLEFFEKDVVFNQEEKFAIIKEHHGSLIGGHRGVKQTIRRIRDNFNWVNIKSDVKDFIKTCEVRQKNKTRNSTVKQPMVITSTSSEPFEKIFLDIVGPLPNTFNGNKYILTIQDDLTKFSYFAYALLLEY
jgi:hypothetical protein